MQHDSQCIFCQIISGQAPATVLYEDDIAIVALPDGGTATDGFTVDYGSFRTQSGWTWQEGAGWMRSQEAKTGDLAELHEVECRAPRPARLPRGTALDGAPTPPAQSEELWHSMQYRSRSSNSRPLLLAQASSPSCATLPLAAR